MKKLLITILLVAATAVSYSQDTNNIRAIPMLLTVREQKAVEADRIRQLQYAAIREVQKVTDTNKLAQITASIIAAQPTNTVKTP